MTLYFLALKIGRDTHTIKVKNLFLRGVGLACCLVSVGIIINEREGKLKNLSFQESDIIIVATLAFFIYQCFQS